MALSDFQELVDRLVRDDAGKIDPLDRDGAIAVAVERYNQDRPRSGVEDLTVDGQLINLPTAWEADFSVLQSLEHPVGNVPPTLVASDRWNLYQSPSGQQIIVMESINGTVRAAFTRRHVLSASVDTLPLGHRDAVCKYAAASLCDQLAALYASDSDSTMSAQVSQGQSRSQAFASRAKEYRKQYQDAIGVQDKVSAPAGAVVQLRATDSSGQPRLFHPPRGSY